MHKKASGRNTTQCTLHMHEMYTCSGFMADDIRGGGGGGAINVPSLENGAVTKRLEFGFIVRLLLSAPNDPCLKEWSQLCDHAIRSEWPLQCDMFDDTSHGGRCPTLRPFSARWKQVADNNKCACPSSCRPCSSSTLKSGGHHFYCSSFIPFLCSSSSSPSSSRPPSCQRFPPVRQDLCIVYKQTSLRLSPRRRRTFVPVTARRIHLRAGALHLGCVTRT